GRDRLVEGGAARGSGLLQQFGKAVQGVGDRGGQRGIDQLGQGREVDVFASEPDGVASAGGGGLGLPGRAQGAGGGDPGPRRPEDGGVGRRDGAGERAGGVRNIPRHVLLECDDVVG